MRHKYVEDDNREARLDNSIIIAHYQPLGTHDLFSTIVVVHRTLRDREN